MRLLCFLVLSLLSVAAYAETYLAIGVYHVGNSTGNTAQSACLTEVTRINGYGGGTNQCGYDSTMCIYWSTSSNVGTCNYTKSGVNDNLILTCPGTGTLSGSNCINATACVLPQVRSVTTGLCTAPAIIACPSGKYAPLGSVDTTACIAIPNCNATSPADGKFFNINTTQCEVATPITICITGGTGTPVNNFYCKTVDDCIPATQLCSNNAVDVATAAAARAAAIAATKAAADAKQAQAAAAATTASSASAAKQSAKTAALSASTAAKTAADAAALNTNLTPAQQAATVSAWDQAVSDFTAASAKAGNSALAAIAATTAAADATTHDNAIPAAIPANGVAYGNLVSDDLGKALTAANDAISGLGSGTGTGQGASASTCTDTGTCANANGTFAGPGSLGGLSGGLTAGYNQGKTLLCNGLDCGLGPTCVTGQCNSSERFTAIKTKLTPTLSAYSTGSCPTATFDLSMIGLGSHVMDSHCVLLESMRSVISSVMSFVSLLSFTLIVLEA